MLNENIRIGGDGLNAWFKTMIEKYPNSVTREHLETVWRMMAGKTIHDNSLQTFLKLPLDKQS